MPLSLAVLFDSSPTPQVYLPAGILTLSPNMEIYTDLTWRSHINTLLNNTHAY